MFQMLQGERIYKEKSFNWILILKWKNFKVQFLLNKPSHPPPPTFWVLSKNKYFATQFYHLGRLYSTMDLKLLILNMGMSWLVRGIKHEAILTLRSTLLDYGFEITHLKYGHNLTRKKNWAWDKFKIIIILSV